MGCACVAHVLLDRGLVAALASDREPDGRRQGGARLDAAAVGEVAGLARDVQLHDVHALGGEVEQEGEALRGAGAAVAAAGVLHVGDVGGQGGRRFRVVVQDVHRVAAAEGQVLQLTHLAEPRAAVLEVHGRRGRPQRDHGRTGERAHRHELLNLHLRADPGHGVTQGQTYLGVGVVHLDRGAVEGREHVVGPVGLRADHVLGDGPDEDDRALEQLAVHRQVGGRTEEARTATHVALHRARVGALDVQAAGVEHQRLAHVGHHLLGGSAQRIQPDGEHATVAAVAGRDRAEHAHLGVLVVGGLTVPTEELGVEIAEVLVGEVEERVHGQQVRRHRRQEPAGVGRTGELETTVDGRELPLLREEGHVLDAEILDLGLQLVRSQERRLHTHGRELRVDALVRQPEDHLLAAQALCLEGHLAEEAHDVLGEHLLGLLAQAHVQLTVHQLDVALGALVAGLEDDARLGRVLPQRCGAVEVHPRSGQDLPHPTIHPLLDGLAICSLPEVTHVNTPKSPRMS